MNLKLLIVEDDPVVITTYERGIKAFNLDSDIKVLFEVSKDKISALEELNNNINVFDAAIVDLDLLGTTGEDKSGNDIIRLIKNNLRFPVFVISGTPHNLDEDLREESSLFRIKARGEEGDYLFEIMQIYKTGITKILNRTGTIEKYITNIFWKHISNSLDLWINDETRSEEDKHKSLLRYTLLHIQEYLELTAESNFEDYHPAEVYITPPIKDKVFTGDIIVDKESHQLFIVLTPSCDLAQAKAKDILIVAIDGYRDGILSEKLSILKKGTASDEEINSANDNLESLIKNSFSNKYHFLPKYRNISGGLINFQKVQSCRYRDFDKKFERIASINSNFTKDIVARFSYYYSRQGSPDFNTNEVLNFLLQ